MEVKKKLVILLIVIILIVIIFLFVIIKNIDKKESESELPSNKERYFQKNVEIIGLNIEGITKNTQKKIESIDGFTKALKEYAMSNNLIDYGNVNLIFIEERQDENKYNLKFKVKDYLGTTIIAEIDLNKGTYEFYNYK